MTEKAPYFSEREVALARANAYLALAVAFSPPSQWPPSFGKDIRNRFERMGGGLSLRGFDLADSVPEASRKLEATSAAHTELFVGPRSALAAPWASMYLDENLHLMGAISLYAAKAYAEAGLGPGFSRKGAPDHIEHELEFMHYLSLEEASTGKAIWQKRQSRFWSEHLGCWVPDLAFTIRRVARHPYYRNLAELLLSFAEQEEEYFVQT